MFGNMKRKIAAVLAAVSLLTVAGGALADYGDAAKDNDWNKSKYHSGDWVQVYDSPLHLTTHRARIKEGIRHSENGKCKGWTYTTYNGDDKNPDDILEVSADRIQSQK